VVALITMFQDFGLSSAAIQRRSITPEQSSALFWINVFASLAIAALLLCLSPLVGLFYGDPRPGYVTAVSGVAIVLTGLGLQQSALLNREMRFGALSIVDIGAAAATFIASAVGALLLRSYWALVLGTICGALVQLTILWSRTRWRPSLRPSVRAGRDLFRYGSHVTAFNFLNFFVRNADNVLIARFAGAAPLGLYDRSYKLMMLPIQNLNGPLQRLLLPTLSRLQDEPARFRNAYRFAIMVLMLATAPGVAVATAFSDKLMPLLLGERWAGAAPIFFWLGLTGLIQPIANMTGVLFMSTGRTGLLMRWGLFSAVVTLAGFAVGLFWGAVGIAASLFLTAVVRLPLLFWLSTGDTAVRQRDLYAAQFLPLVGAAAAVLLATTWKDAFTAGPFFCLSIPLAYVLSLLGLTVLPEGRDTLRQGSRMLKGSVGQVGARFSRRRAA
jgi:polysaccharide transporter, PST family